MSDPKITKLPSRAQSANTSKGTDQLSAETKEKSGASIFCSGRGYVHALVEDAYSALAAAQVLVSKADDNFERAAGGLVDRYKLSDAAGQISTSISKLKVSISRGYSNPHWKPSSRHGFLECALVLVDRAEKSKMAVPPEGDSSNFQHEIIDMIEERLAKLRAQIPPAKDGEFEANLSGCTLRPKWDPKLD